MSAKIPPIGTLRDKVQLQAKNMFKNSAGGHEVSYVPIASVWANVSANNGNSMQLADSNMSAISHIVLLRFRNDIGAGDRIIYRNKTLEIISLNDLNSRKAYIKCLCSEKIVRG